MTETDYSFENGKFLSNGKTVAEVKDGKIVFQKGMAGAHKEALHVWMEQNGITVGEKPAAEEAPKLELEDTPPVDIDDIPDDALPPFDKMLGTETPGFKEWCKRYNLTETERVKLIRRLEKR